MVPGHQGHHPECRDQGSLVPRVLEEDERKLKRLTSKRSLQLLTRVEKMEHEQEPLDEFTYKSRFTKQVARMRAQGRFLQWLRKDGVFPEGTEEYTSNSMNAKQLAHKKTQEGIIKLEEVSRRWGAGRMPSSMPGFQEEVGMTLNQQEESQPAEGFS